jgi:hypothetical protein
MNYYSLKKAKKQWYHQRYNSINTRNIPFLLTFDEWIKIWEDSGEYLNRGKTSGKFVMSRYNDIGPYTVGNVFIQPCNLNNKDGMTGRAPWSKGKKFTEEHRQKITDLNIEMNKVKNFIQITCPHCNKIGQKIAMKRWHFENCKEKK